MNCLILSKCTFLEIIFRAIIPKNFDEMNTYYFDYASTTPVDLEVVNKMKDCMSIDGTLSLIHI